MTQKTMQKIKETKQKKNGIIFNKNGIKITADSVQYILDMNGYNTAYYTTLSSLFEEVYERKQKENLIDAKDKSIEGILETLQRTRTWVKRLLKPLNATY